MHCHITCLLSPTSCYLVWSSRDCIEAVSKGILQNNDQSTGLWKLHWGMQAVRVKWAKALSCWNDNCSMIHVWLNSGITEYLIVSRYETPSNIITFHNVSRQAAEVNCNSSEKRTSSWDSTCLWHCLMSALLSTYTNTGWNDFITRPLLWSNMVECITQISADHFYTDLHSDCSMESATATHINFQNIGWLLQGESSTFPCEKVRFPQYKRTILCEDGLLNHCCDHVITWFITGPMLTLYAPTCLLLNAHQWDNCQNLPQSMSHNMQLLMRKRDSGAGLWLWHMFMDTQGCQAYI
jgi:hypothetical protein